VKRAVVLALGLSCWTACGDPIRDQAVSALGGEERGVEPGPLHRPGQPCLVCHDSHEASAFALAGTIYARAAGRVPLDRVKVLLTDSSGKNFEATTNCAGNFFLRRLREDPKYPVWVTLAVDDKKIDMESPIFREGSCAACHTDPIGPASAGHAYFLLDEDADLGPEHYCR
jgi:hypothetical protein